MREILDLNRYPLDTPGSPEYRALVDRCKSEMQANGLFDLPGFMRQSAIDATLSHCLPKFETEAFRHERMHNIYFKKTIPDVPLDHAAYTQFSTSNLTLCGDQVTQTPVTKLYEWPPFARFLADIMGRDALYPMDDPLACLNVMAYFEGQGLNWHFDRSEFTTTLLLQAPEAGSTFLYKTDLRSADDPNYEGVARLVRGEDPDVQALDAEPGTLNVFRGVNTPHCVTPAQGPNPRVVSVLTYYETPGAQFTREERLGFYGRAE